MKASQGQSGIIEPAYAYLPGISGGEEVARTLGVDYFAVPVEFGMEGALKAYPIGSLSDYEEDLLQKAIIELKGNIAKGESHAQGKE
jgi:malate dehydrogenase